MGALNDKRNDYVLGKTSFYNLSFTHEYIYLMNTQYEHLLCV